MFYGRCMFFWTMIIFYTVFGSDDSNNIPSVAAVTLTERSPLLVGNNSSSTTIQRISDSTATATAAGGAAASAVQQSNNVASHTQLSSQQSTTTAIHPLGTASSVQDYKKEELVCEEWGVLLRHISAIAVITGLLLKALVDWDKHDCQCPGNVTNSSLSDRDINHGTMLLWSGIMPFLGAIILVFATCAEHKRVEYKGKH